ncbi:DNA-binding transcriptional ArsR family regulator [Actinoalloteichus hoggarensis]|uniref:Helix-turn-helix domain protein n=1 Tax=Actinoalloteichus hoggarensis TaxID=1470176 RepID=A0A221W7M4_9PSEU|nr:winged helix-turn-helix domain-containing protein [Actinoalloteichus hoggarensis]ASO21703.1 Helix-turn-helix domain protein [Actinoalloteichus hoggarensis]MBB5922297.1 DNA-binding transcriptional ArsR family regulator [Actinoalloteichus hoggarensis]
MGDHDSDRRPPRENSDDPGTPAPPIRQRRKATPEEIKALSHPLRLRILRLCGQHELTNKELADRLGRDPGTVLYHVRQLVAAGLLAQAPVRTGASGALEKPYTYDGAVWWLEGPLSGTDAVGAPIEAFHQELNEAGPESLQAYERFALHLSPAEVDELDARIHAVLHEYITTDHERRDRPLINGVFILHRMAE